MTLGRTARKRFDLGIAQALVIAATFALSSCGYGNDKAAAESSVATFHSRLNSGETHAIYAGADDVFRKATSEPDFSAFIDAVRRKLGDVEHSQLTNYRVGYFTGQGTVVTLDYQTEFTGGAGTEEFIWHIQDKQPLLVGYHINSNALVLK
jgi:Protein of unknown function (DUF4019)